MTQPNREVFEDLEKQNCIMEWLDESRESLKEATEEYKALVARELVKTQSMLERVTRERDIAVTEALKLRRIVNGIRQELKRE